MKARTCPKNQCSKMLLLLSHSHLQKLLLDTLFILPPSHLSILSQLLNFPVANFPWFASQRVAKMGVNRSWVNRNMIVILVLYLSLVKRLSICICTIIIQTSKLPVFCVSSHFYHQKNTSNTTIAITQMVPMNTKHLWILSTSYPTRILPKWLNHHHHLWMVLMRVL